jgi:hypothetical protein
MGHSVAPGATKCPITELLNPHTGYGSRDDQLLDLARSFEDRVDDLGCPGRVAWCCDLLVRVRGVRLEVVGPASCRDESRDRSSKHGPRFAGPRTGWSSYRPSGQVTSKNQSATSRTIGRRLSAFDAPMPSLSPCAILFRRSTRKFNSRPLSSSSSDRNAKKEADQTGLNRAKSV